MIAVLFTTVVVFYLILSLVSAHNAKASPVAGTQSAQADTAAVGSVISTTR